MTGISQGLLLFMADVTARVTLLLICTAIIAILSRRASASFRHMIWMLGLGSALFMPLLTPALPGWRIPVRTPNIRSVTPSPFLTWMLSNAPAPRAAIAPHARFANAMPGKRALRRSVLRSLPMPFGSAAASAPAPAAQPDWPLWALLVWGAGAVFVLAQLARGLLSVRRIDRESEPVTQDWAAGVISEARTAMGIVHPITVRRMSAAGRVTVPLTYGALSPVIVLPAEADRWPVERLRAAILHELAHVRRRDWLLQVGAHLVRALYWFHPLVWLAARRARAEGEAACDNLVLATGMPAREYARQLLDVALSARRRFRFEPDPAAGAVAMAQTPRVEGRLRRILAPNGRRGEVTGKRRAAIWGIGMCVLVIGAMVRPVSRAAGGRRARAHATRARSTAPVAGRVVTPDGAPVPHVAVFWIERGEDFVSRRRFVTETDAQGQFRFTEPSPGPDENRSVTLLAQTPGWGLSPLNVPTELPAPALLTLTLQSATTLHVSFIDAAGKPVPNIHVRVRVLFDRKRAFLQIPADMHGRWEQKTDAQGACVFPGLPQGAQARFTIEEDAFAEPSFEDAVSLDNTTTQQAGPIRLLPGGFVQGRVTLADGTPAADVSLEVQGVGPADGGGEAITDANGRFRITHLAAGVYNIAIYLHGELERSHTAVALEKAEIRPGATLQHDFVLITGAQITGKVTDKETGEPIPNVEIGVYGPAHPRSGAAVQYSRTGPDGVYHLRVPAGQQYVYVMGLHDNRYERPKEGVDVTLAEGATLTQDFTMTPSALPDPKPIRIHVVGPDGRAVANATVEVVQLGDPPDAIPASELETDGAGACVIPMFAASARLRARSGALATEKTVLAQNGEEVTLQLKPDLMLTLSGRVLDDKGRLLPGAKVTLYEWQFDEGHNTLTAKTDAQGRFVFASVFPDARYSVSAEASGYGQRSTNPSEYRPGDRADLGAIRLPRAANFVAGRVVDEHGNPVPKQTILMEGIATGMREVVTDAAGNFRIEGVVNEALALRLKNNGSYDPNRKLVHAGDKEVILVCRSAHAAAPATDAQNAAALKRRSALLQHPGPALKTAAWLNTSARMPDDLKRKIVVIDFWAVNCGPCVASLPAVEKLSRQFPGKNVAVIGLHGSGIDPSELKGFARAHGLTYPIAIDSEDPHHASFGQTMTDYGVYGIPTVAVLDRKGNVRYLDFGLDGAVKVVGELLAAERPR